MAPCCGGNSRTGRLKRALNYVLKVPEVGVKMLGPRVSARVRAKRWRICRKNECGLYYLSEYDKPFCGEPYDASDGRNEKQFGCGCSLSRKIPLKKAHCPQEPSRW